MVNISLFYSFPIFNGQLNFSLSSNLKLCWITSICPSRSTHYTSSPKCLPWHICTLSLESFLSVSWLLVYFSEWDPRQDVNQKLEHEVRAFIFPCHVNLVWLGSMIVEQWFSQAICTFRPGFGNCSLPSLS